MWKFLLGNYYPAHMYSKGQNNWFCPSLYLSVCTKIARSQDLGIWVTHNHNKSVETFETLYSASNHLIGPTSVTNTAFCWPHLSTAPPCAFNSACVHNLAQYSVGKGRQQSTRILLQCADRCTWIICCLWMHCRMHANAVCMYALQLKSGVYIPEILTYMYMHAWYD